MKLGVGEVFSCFSSSLCVYRASGHSIRSKIAIFLLMPIESIPYILSDLYAECISQITYHRVFPLSLWGEVDQPALKGGFHSTQELVV